MIGIFPVSNTEIGGALAFPDACKTPTPAGPIPIPYPNIAVTTIADKGTCPDKVKVCGNPPIVQTSEIPATLGDQPGVAGGVVSNEFGQNMKPILFSLIARAQGKGMVYFCCLTDHNDNNAMLAAMLVPSQFKVKVLF